MRTGFALVVCLLLLTIPISTSTGWAPSPGCPVLPDPQILAAFDEVIEFIGNLPRDTLKPWLRISLIWNLECAKRTYQQGHPCTAIYVLKAFLMQAQALRRGPGLQVAELLYNQGRMLRGRLFDTLSDHDHCARHKRFGKEPVVEVKVSDNTHLVASMSFGEPNLVSAEVEGELFTQIFLPGVATVVGQAGLPAVPTVSRLVAVPRGADVSLKVRPPVVAEMIRLNLFPFQPSYPDTDEFPDINYHPPFTKDEAAYSSNGPFPSEACSVMKVGQMRDLSLALVTCAAGKFYPKADLLILYEKTDFELRFSGGSGAFVTTGSQNPFESQTADFAKLVLNEADIFNYVEDRVPAPVCPGEELLIFTHQDFRPAADKLAKWKNEKGILTNVVEVNSSTTAQDIVNYIHQRYEDCVVRPSYVLLLGDAEFVPTFYVSTVFSAQSASDFPYSNYPSFLSDILPDFGVGRIPVDTLQQAHDVIDKIINYEKYPPSAPAFYKNISLAAMFQCCRLDAPTPMISFDPHPTDGWDGKAYIQTAELVRDELIALGYSAERIYNHGTCDKYWWNNLHSSDTPRFYYDGTPLPTDIGENSGFAWNGSQQDIINAFNNGRFLIMHRDHGSENGWFLPNFNKNSIDQLNNNLLPVIFSINCSSGFFDHETNPGEPPPDERVNQPYPCVPGPGQSYTCNASQQETYFAERLLRKAEGGVVGVIAPSRDTPDLGDDALTRGLFDAVWPGIDPKIGFGATSTRRLGDILNYAKLYTLSQCGIQQSLEKPVYPLDVLAVFSLFHLLGDPTLELWTSSPITLSADFKLEALADALHIEYGIDNATITALQQKESGLAPIGRATVKNGEATLHYVVEPEADMPILLSASLENGISQSLTALQPIDLADEDVFTDSAIRITFDEEDRYLFEPISHQYESFGVVFLDDETCTPLILDEASRLGTTRTEPYSLSNTDTVDPEIEGVPLTMFFDNPIRRVGMYIGNGGPGSTAVLSAYGQDDEFIFSVERTIVGENVETFMGLDAGSASIAKLQLNYGNTFQSEEIDNLVFE